MPAKIINISSDSVLLNRKGISVGDSLISINGHKIRDVLDYKFYAYDSHLVLQTVDTLGKIHLIRVSKESGTDLGLEFETYLMDKPRACANKCLFCFVDQLPDGLRESLYFKDDDTRLSFLQGNYITLTNIGERDIERIIALHISPMNVSVHATNPEVRKFLLGNKNAGRGFSLMQRLASAGIMMNCQIVCCPGINDGEELLATMRDLESLYPYVPSVSIVPVGLTKYRENLHTLKPFDKETAQKTIKMVEKFAENCLAKHKSRIFFCSDELYLTAGYTLPNEEYYEDYPQFENGVGMLRSLITEFEDEFTKQNPDAVGFTAVTGTAAAPFIDELYQKAKERYPQLSGKIVAVENDFFGHSINVAGLITGRDIIKKLSGIENLGERLIIPRNMLRHGETVFLDDVTIPELEKATGTKVRIVEQDGRDVVSAFYGK